MFFQPKSKKPRFAKPDLLNYQRLSPRVMLAGDLSASTEVLDLHTHVPSEILNESKVGPFVEGPTQRIVINEDIGAAGSREYAEPFDAVVALAQGCTGTLIAPNVVLSARHCETPVGGEIFFGPDSNNPIYTATVASVFRPAGTGSLLDGGDVEIITLTAPVPANIATPMRLIDATDELQGQLAATVGYGFNGLGNQGHLSSTDGFRWGGENIIDVYGTPADDTGSNIISTDFDDGSAAANTITGSDPTPLELEATTAPGDSGGPILVRSGSEWVIAGVLSGGTTNTSVYGDISWWTGTAIYRAEIESVGGVFVAAEAGDVRFDAPSYTEVGTINLSVNDSNAVGPVTVVLEVSSGDVEVLTLTQQDAGTYTGSINSDVVAGSSVDGVLQVADDDIITASYFDADDGNGASITVTDTAVVFVDDFGDNASEANSIDFPLNISGEIEQAIDQDWFGFTAETGLQYSFQTASGSLSGSTLTIFDSAGTNVSQSNSGEISWLPSVAGEYFIVVASSSSGLGTYVLTGTEVVPQSEVEFTSAAFPENGIVGVNLFEPNSTGPVTVTIESSSGDSETLTLQSDGNVDYSANISLASGVANPGDGALQVSAEDTITVTYFDPDDGLGGTSTSIATATITGDDHGNNSITATTVATPFSVTGDLEENSDEDWFRFTATAGVNYVFETSLTTLSDSTLRLYDTDGTTQLAFDDDGGAGLASLITWQAPADGDYFLSVQAFSPTQTGTYQLSGQVSGVGGGEDDHGNSSATATPVADVFSVSGQLEQGSDEDWFSFNAIAGADYTFVTSLTTLSDSTLTLYDTNGTTQLAFNDDGGAGLASLINWQAPTSAVYFLSVQGFSTTQTGSYQLSGASTVPVTGTVVGRHVFYDGSSFDGDEGVHSANDDAALDSEKSPLVTGNATFNNYTNYEHGITGLFIDIDELPTTPQVGDFEFRVGNTNDPSNWSLLDAAPDISVRFGDGDAGSARVSLIWPAGTIVDQWIEVRVLATGPGNIVGNSDVHYWGNQRGDTGNSAADTTVDAGDVSHISAHFSGFDSVDATSQYDLNKDGRVDSGDVSAVSSMFSGFSPTLQMITAPSRAQADIADDETREQQKAEPIEDVKAIKEIVTEEPATANSIADTAQAVDRGAEHEDSTNSNTNSRLANLDVSEVPNGPNVLEESEGGLSNLSEPNVVDTLSILAGDNDKLKVVTDAFSVERNLVGLTPAAGSADIDLGKVVVDFPDAYFAESTLPEVSQPASGTSTEIIATENIATEVAQNQHFEALPVLKSEMFAGRFDRLQRRIERLESKDELSQRQQRRLESLQTREAIMLAAVTEQNSQIEFADSMHQIDVDDVFSTFRRDDFLPEDLAQGLVSKL